MHMRRRYRIEPAVRPTSLCHDQHISLIGSQAAISELNRLIEESTDSLISSLSPEPIETSPQVYTYDNGRWRSQVVQSQVQPRLSLQVYAVNSEIAPSNVTAQFTNFLESHAPQLLREITVCLDPVVDSPFDTGDAPFDTGDAPFDTGDAPFDTGDAPFDTGDAPFDTGDAPFDTGDAPFDTGDAPFDTGDAPLVVDPTVAGNTVAGQPAMERTGFNWLRQGRPDLDGSDLTVLILDTLPVQGEIDVAHEFVDFWVDWVGASAPTPIISSQSTSTPYIPAAEAHRYHGVMAASIVRRLAPASNIVAARVLDDYGKGWSTTVIQAIIWALSHRKNKTKVNGRRLIHDKLIFNLSMGLPRTQAEEAEAVCLLRILDMAARAATLTVAAAGNDSLYKHENPVEPAAFGFFADTRATAEQVIAVAGTNRLTEYAMFSNEGHIAAPCRHIVCDTGAGSKIERNYGYSTVCWSGTSFATPQVTGLAALLWSSGRIPFYKIKQHIWRTARPPQKWNGVREIDYLCAFRAL